MALNVYRRNRREVEANKMIANAEADLNRLSLRDPAWEGPKVDFKSD